MKDILKETCKHINIKRGIYFLFDKREIVYIGQSEFIEKRVFDHVLNKDFDSYNFIEYLKDVSLNEIEADFILKYQPKYNKTIPENKLWISRGLLSRVHKIPMLKTRRLIKENKVECIEFNTIQYLRWGSING